MGTVQTLVDPRFPVFHPQTEYQAQLQLQMKMKKAKLKMMMVMMFLVDPAGVDIPSAWAVGRTLGSGGW